MMKEVQFFLAMTEEKTVEQLPVEPSSGNLISLDYAVLRTVKVSHNQYGIRHGNYLHYRHYCTRKLMRLRRSLKLTNGNKRYTKKEIKADSVNSDRYLLIPLYQAERAWAYAMQMKDEAGASEVPPRVYFHLVKRFKKAVQWCHMLSTLAEGKVDDKTALEIEAYTSWMNGNLLIEKEQWADVIEDLVKTRTIYEKMGKLGDPEEQELYKERVGEIDTSLRYCHFNQNGGTIDDIKTLVDLHHSQKGDSYDLLNAKLESVLQETRKRQSSGMDKISWKGRSIPLKSEKIRVALLGADEIRSELSDSSKDQEAKLSLYTNLFMAYGDTLEAIRSELKQVSAKNAKQRSSKAETEESNLSYLLTYISYLKLTKTVERNLILLTSLKISLKQKGKKTKPDELVRIYDNLIQNYKDLEELGDAEDVETKKSIVAKALSCRALRCYYLANSYVNSFEWAKALALFDRASEHITVAKKHHLDCATHDKEEIAHLEEASASIGADKCLIKAKAHLESLGIKQEQDTENQLTQFIPTACKPVIFDLAHAEMDEFPDLEPAKAAKSFWKFW